jgi:hypothetical protein
MNLESEISQYRQKIATDSYPMSIGELVNLYRDGEIEVHPEFQRIFRWSDGQRTRLIESVLLGIPLPSIFVAQGETGVWDVVDGVQRLSTIFQFMGILKDEYGELVEPLRCVSAPFLKSLDGVTFESSDDSQLSLDKAQQLDFKRARIDIKIIKRESDNRAKYDLFQRLNSFGSQATQQELRNCLLVSMSKQHFHWLQEVSSADTFLKVLDLPERLIDEQYNMELALRFVVLRNLPSQDISKIGNIGDFLSDELVPLVERDEEFLRDEAKVMQSTFRLLLEAAGTDALRKWNPDKDRSEGSISSTAFEVLALGVGHYIADRSITAAEVTEKRKELWKDPNYGPGHATGQRADQRMKRTIPYGRKLFSGI